jgi:hypothetical protein
MKCAAGGGASSLVLPNTLADLGHRVRRRGAVDGPRDEFFTPLRIVCARDGLKGAMVDIACHVLFQIAVFLHDPISHVIVRARHLSQRASQPVKAGVLD